MLSEIIFEQLFWILHRNFEAKAKNVYIIDNE